MTTSGLGFILYELIDFIGDDDDVRVFSQHFGNSGKFGFGKDAAAGVAGCVEHEDLGLGRDGLLELLGRDLEVVLEVALDDDGHAAGQLHHFGVRDPERGRDDDLVAVVQDGQ